MAGVWINGLGLVCGAGCSAEAVWEAIASGRTAIRPATRFTVPVGRNSWVASAPIEPGSKHGAAPDDSGGRLCLAMARGAAGAALRGCDPERRARLALMWASNVEDQHLRMHELAARLADELGLGGARFGVSVACASATLAAGLAARMLASGDLATGILVVAADVITPRVIAGFEQLGLLADEPCVPFSPRIGTSLGEGAAALLLDDVRRAEGATRIAGWGSANDAHHPTQPHPGGEGLARALGAALVRARRDGEAIEHVCAHGTGTAANDGAEALGIARALGRRSVSVASHKALVGHTQGACGLVELAASLIAIERGAHPPTVGFERPRAGAPAQVVGPRPRPGEVRTWACINSGFGGSNAALVLTRDAPEPNPDPSPAPVYMVGAGVCEPERSVGIDRRTGVRGVDLRALEPWTLALTVALSDALEAAKLRPSRHEPTGLFVGQARVSTAQVRRLADEYARLGLYGANANTFTQTFLGAPASAAAASLGLRGPFGVCTEGTCAGLVALVHACEAVREGAARSMLVGEVAGELERAEAVALALASGPRAKAAGTGPAVRVRAHGFAATLAQAREQALRRAGREPGGRVELELGDRGLAGARSAYDALRNGEVELALIGEAQPGALACAIVLEAHDR